MNFPITVSFESAVAPPARSSRLGGSITTITVRIRAFAVSPRTSLQPGPSRAIRRTESNYERGHNGGKVKHSKQSLRALSRRDAGANQKMVHLRWANNLAIVGIPGFVRNGKMRCIFDPERSLRQ